MFYKNNWIHSKHFETISVENISEIKSWYFAWNAVTKVVCKKWKKYGLQACINCCVLAKKLRQMY